MMFPSLDRSLIDSHATRKGYQKSEELGKRYKNTDKLSCTNHTLDWIGLLYNIWDEEETR
jgi:hypothetical protein